MSIDSTGAYPSNIGKPWGDDEIVQLLKNVQKKKTIDEIAVIHRRTYGGIYSRLREIAADYHFNDGRSIEEIIKFTGLSEENINDAILRRANRQEYQQEKEKIRELKKQEKEKTRELKKLERYEKQERLEQLATETFQFKNRLDTSSEKDVNLQILETLVDIKDILIQMNKRLDTFEFVSE